MEGFYPQIKRLIDVSIAAVVLVFTLPLSLWVGWKISRTGPVFYRATRVGRGERLFAMLKFRTMVVDADAIGGESTASGDPRITPLGAALRRFKLDELPQLINVLRGEMSLVGPRPTTEYSLIYYPPEDRELVFSVPPGITDYASLEYSNEGEILAGATDPDRAYYERIAPGKIALQTRYAKESSLLVDGKLLLLTAYTVFLAPFGLRRPSFSPSDSSQRLFIEAVLNKEQSSMQAIRELAGKIRQHSLDMTHRGGGSHIGSCLSIADIMAVLYGETLRFRAEDPEWKERDRFILSKGHAGAAVYAALAEVGFFPVDWLKDHYQDGSVLSGHVSHKGVPGVELSTGSLGHGLSVGAGRAYAAKLSGESYRTFVLMSDGECDEGSNWEAILFAAHHELDQLVAIVDYNKIQSLDTVAATLGLEPFRDKWESFGWEVREVDGHDHAALAAAFDKPGDKKPVVVIAHTTKGKGVSFMEESVLWHYRSPQGEEYAAAVKELGGES